MSVVIVGGGQAGLQVADSLRAEGYDRSITVIAEEAGLPYQRPPLSKDYLALGKDPAPLPVRGQGFFDEKAVRLLAGVAATAIDRTSHRIALSDGTELPYTNLVLATGARNRTLDCPGTELPGIHALRTLGDAEALHTQLPSARNVVVVGAGFIGLEFAAAARAHGCTTTVLEYAARPMGRALTPTMSDWFVQAHRELGVHLRLSEGIERFEAGPDGRVAAAVSSTGCTYPTDLVVVGVGVLPNDMLAAEAGLETTNGIVVDETLRTADPNILAVGDCANFPNVHAGARTRLESVQNATDQARHAARTILGIDDPYIAFPWFWSTQGPYRLQMAGLTQPSDDTLVLGDLEEAKFSVLCFRTGMLTAVESVNTPADHMAARKLLAAGVRLTRAEAEADGFTLRTAVKAATGLPA
ncbi:NAD(P)/FAD-dependent oxidoreductase [Arthrobacter sp. Marseille-P9274]|uniref:NAD(P)/FAD-dependent oxidoreductase n=1 Tax=Arthrobacter sp. Marseille-P9274 TaxID=2866572 RepID=UPI0021C85801|nr:FAD-dependent oxidoreductase [Arthrobacter sp. Marseille-P9274]